MCVLGEVGQHGRRPHQGRTAIGGLGGLEVGHGDRGRAGGEAAEEPPDAGGRSPGTASGDEDAAMAASHARQNASWRPSRVRWLSPVLDRLEVRAGVGRGQRRWAPAGEVGDGVGVGERELADAGDERLEPPGRELDDLVDAGPLGVGEEPAHAVGAEPGIRRRQRHHAGVGLDAAVGREQHDGAALLVRAAEDQERRPSRGSRRRAGPTTASVGVGSTNASYPGSSGSSSGSTARPSVVSGTARNPTYARATAARTIRAWPATMAARRPAPADQDLVGLVGRVGGHLPGRRSAVEAPGLDAVDHGGVSR